jgi:hypothetical protein
MKNRSFGPALAFLAALIVAAVLPRAASAGSSPSPAAAGYLYKTTFVRAAPGKLLDLIALIKGRMAVMDAAGDERPLWWRHTQGDQWDLMLLAPMGSYAEYYSKDRISRREKAAAASPLSDRDFRAGLDACSSWREDVFVTGPPLEDLRKASAGMAYYHIEIFISLPGRQAELSKEREMENAYQVGTGRPATLVFVRDQGAAWDLFSLGCYRDLKHWADGGDASKEQRDQAARRAGFKDADAIGPYMRTLIDMHRDTMGVAIK